MLLSRLRVVIQKVLSGAADKVAPNTEAKQVLQTPDLSIEDLIRYPPETKGIPVISLDKILSSQFEILRLMQRDSGMPDSEGYENGRLLKTKKKRSKGDVKSAELELNFDTLFRQVVANYIKYTHLLPASENHHHSDVGGLLRHSLEVALHSFRKSQHQVLPAIGHLDEEQNRKPRWQYAAWICGLLHDAGKILYDMRVYDTASGKDWNPYLSDLFSWSETNNVNRYRVTWRPEHRHKKHENLGVQILEWVLTPEAKVYLMDNSDELPIAINHTLAHYGSNDGYLQECVREADSKSTEKDIRTQWHEMLGKRRYPLESAIVNALRRLRDNWEVNKPKGHIWIIGEEVYLSWPKTVQLIIQRLQSDNVDVPVNPTKILEILEERNLVERLDDSVTYSMFTPQLPDVSAAERVIKLSWPGLLYETMPVPRTVPGTLRLNNDGKTIAYKLDGSIVEKLTDSVLTDNVEEADEKPTEKDVQVQAANKELSEDSSTKETKKNKPKNNEAKNKKKPSTQVVTPNENEPTKSSKGLLFANQNNTPQQPVMAKKEPATKVDVQPTQETVAQEVRDVMDTPTIRTAEKLSDEPQRPPAQINPVETDSDLVVPDYLNKIDYNDNVDDNSFNNSTEPPSYLSGSAESQPIEQKQQEKTVPHAATTKKASGAMLRRKKQKQNGGGGSNVSSKKNSANKGWLGKRKHGRHPGDIFLIDVLAKMANGELGIEPGQGVFLVDGQLHLDVQALSQVSVVDANETGKVATDLKNARFLDYDKFKPNLLVQRKVFGSCSCMVISLTKPVSDQIREELGLTVSTVDYTSKEIPIETKSQAMRPGTKKASAEKKGESSNSAKHETGNQKASDEITLFLRFLSEKSGEENLSYMQRTENGKWGIYVTGAIKAFTEELREGANANGLSKELAMLAVGIADLETGSGKKKHLLIEKELIG